MKEFCLFGIVTVLFALTFALAGVTAFFVAHGISLINLCSGAYGDCVDTSSGQMFILAAFFAIVALGFGGAAWLVLRLGKMPSWFVMPIWILAFSSVVIFLSISGESTVGLYITAFLWIPVTLLVVGIIYICLLLHYRRESRPPRLKRDSK